MHVVKTLTFTFLDVLSFSDARVACFVMCLRGSKYQSFRDSFGVVSGHQNLLL